VAYESKQTIVYPSTILPFNPLTKTLNYAKKNNKHIKKFQAESAPAFYIHSRAYGRFNGLYPVDGLYKA
jgi:hypothetical protein